MSAYMCDDTHLTALAAYACMHRVLAVQPWGDLTVRDLTELFQAANERSVNYRYPSKDNGERSDVAVCPRGIALAATATPVQIAKSVDCFAYQSDEHPGWKASAVAALCILIRAHAERRHGGPIATDSREYDSAEWGAPRQRA